MNAIDQRASEIEKLLAAPMTVRQVMEAADVCKSTALLHVSRLYTEGRVHISGWIPVRSQIAAIYCAGDGEDAAKPVRTKIIKAHGKPGRPCKHEEPAANPIHLVRDPLVAALFGAVA